MSVITIGPIHLTYHYDPAFRWVGTAGAYTRGVQISGMLHWDDAKALQELVANEARRVSLGEEAEGVLEPVFADDALLRDYNGWYLLQSVDVGAEQRHSLHDFVPCSIEAALLSDRQVILKRGSRVKATSLALTPQSVAAQPLWTENTDAAFPSEAGGILRSYDPRTEYDPSSPINDDGHELRVLVDTFVDDVDQMPTRVAIEYSQNGSVPTWPAYRGGDVRAHDRRAGRNVYGPQHAFAEPSDLLLMNGLLRLWVGSRGTPPHVAVQAFASGRWQQIGVIALSDPTNGDDILHRARLTRLTPDEGVVHIEARELGEIWLTLRRGERMVRVRSGALLSPTVITQRSVRWINTPPHKTLTAPLTGAEAVLLDGAVVGGRAELWWPQAARIDDWAVAFRWITDAASDADDPPGPLLAGDDSAGDGVAGGSFIAQEAAGLLAILDSEDEQVTVSYDADEARLVLGFGANALESPVLDFDAGTEFLVIVGWNETDGMRLSWSIDGGAMQHLSEVADLPTSDPAWTSYRIGEADGLTSAGVVDDYRVFASRLTDAECEAMVAATHGTDHLPDPEALMVQHVPLDIAPIVAASSLSGGRITDAAADEYGLTRGVAVLAAGYAAAGLGVSLSMDSIEAAAFVAAADEAAADHHAQFAAESVQQLKPR